MGRRIEKKVYDWDDQAEEWEATPSLHRKFVWGGTGGSSASGWLLLMELDGNDDPVRKYTWGLDLAGQMGSAGVPPASLESAGGIGGLLAVYDSAEEEDFVYLYDANGNVGQVIDLDAASASAAIKAHYEYDPYGNIVNQTGAYAEDNPYRFSTKPFDNETGLGYWGYRYYSPRTGRWLSRDPIGEYGDANLYAFVRNTPSVLVDPLGLSDEWIVSVTQGSDYASVDAQFTVKVHCCKCDAIKWVSLFKEKRRGPKAYIWPTTEQGPDLGKDKRRRDWPWYPHSYDYEVPGRECKRNSEFKDTPGVWPAWMWIELKQDFETCAVCIKKTRSGSTACVLGCILWGHHYVNRLPYFSLLSGCYCSRRTHTIYGNQSTPVGPTTELMDLLSMAKYVTGLEVADSCARSPCE